MSENHTHRKRGKKTRFGKAAREGQLIELLAYWGGGTTAEEIGHVIGGLRREAAQSRVTDLKQIYGKSLTYNPVTRRVELNVDPGDLKFTPYESDKTLDFLIGEKIAAENRGESPPLAIEMVDVSTLVPHPLRPDVLRAVIAAITRHRLLHIDYQSPRGRSVLFFSPHAIVWASGRYHARGHAFRMNPADGNWIDLVLSRIVSVVSGVRSSVGDYIPSDGDTDWYRRQDISFSLSPNLTTDAALALRLEYGLEEEGGMTVKNVRIALAQYVIREVTARTVYGFDLPIWVYMQSDQATNL